jgi:general secretion pathway protein G
MITKKSLRTKKGFTILELLVVVGIIGLLITAGTVSYTTVQKKARDTKRRTDLRDIQNSFEQYYSTCGFQYPYSATGVLSAGNQLTCANPVANYIFYPKDPLGSNYTCATSCTITSYTICPPIVNGPSGLMESDNCDTTNRNCCLTNRQ